MLHHATPCYTMLLTLSVSIPLRGICPTQEGRICTETWPAREKSQSLITENSPVVRVGAMLRTREERGPPGGEKGGEDELWLCECVSVCVCVGGGGLRAEINTRHNCQIDGQANRPRQTDGQTDKQTDRQIDRWTKQMKNRWTDRQMDRQMDRWTDW